MVKIKVLIYECIKHYSYLYATNTNDNIYNIFLLIPIPYFSPLTKTSANEFATRGKSRNFILSGNSPQLVIG